jgi:putative ABC transport system ATP-binding protein
MAFALNDTEIPGSRSRHVALGRHMVRLDRVSKVFRRGAIEASALREVDIELEKGEFRAVVGPSGSGKSTILHLIAGLDSPTAGQIVVEDRLLSVMTADEITIFRRRRIGMVFQFFNLLPSLTAAENVALPLLLDGKRMSDVRSRVDRMLALVGLSHRSQHRPDDLSGGEMQRIAVARALVTEPVLLLADEPTGNLDSATGTQVLELIRHANREQGQTVVLVTHDLAAAAAYADRVTTLRDGSVVDELSTRGPQRE